MRQLTRPRSPRSLIAAACATTLAAGLLTFTPTVTSPASAAGPDVDDTTSVDVHKVDIDAAPNLDTKSDPLPDPVWPQAGKTEDLPVTDSDKPADSKLGVSSDDPEGAPDAVTVQSQGQLAADSPVGPGVAYTIDVPAANPDPAAPETPDPTTPTPGTDDGDATETPVDPLNPAIFRTAVFHSDDPEPSPTPTPSTTPETPEPTAPPTDDPQDPTDPADPPTEPDPYTAPLELRIPYESFEGAYGGNWGNRLHAVLLEDCATVDGLLSCQKTTPLESTNDSENKTVVAVLPPDTYAATDDTADPDGSAMNPASFKTTDPDANPTVVGVTAGAAGTSGNFAATPLSAAGTWSSGGNTGDFNWSYSFNTPPAAGGPEPGLNLSYSSGSVDGRTSGSNNQTGPFGEGFNLDPGYVERSYIPCRDDDTTNSNSADDYKSSDDLCWKGNRLTLSLNGKSSRVVMNGNVGRFEKDDGTRIVRHAGITEPVNGAYGNESFEATTPDGTVYTFGKQWVGTGTATDSVSTVKVFGNQPGEDCHETSFTGSGCAQGWRWSLDQVVDTNGNTMTYYYQQEENNYKGRYAQTTTPYDRGVRLLSIEYGTRIGDVKDDFEHDKEAPARVVFNNTTRCVEDAEFKCKIEDFTSANASHWPDVPYDRICYSSDNECTGRTGPTFFSTTRVDKITTEVSSGDHYTPVTTWDLDEDFLNSGDGTDRALWLNSIKKTGRKGFGSEAAEPMIQFGSVQMVNRVDQTGDGVEPFVKRRIKSIRNGSGGLVTVNYSDRECSYNNIPATGYEDSSISMCFPVYYQPDYATGHVKDFFNKYTTKSVVESDLVGNAPNKTTRYTYVGKPAWHYDESEALEPQYRTFSDWRGYTQVITQVGNESEASWSETYYLRGLDKDKTLKNGTNEQDPDAFRDSKVHDPDDNVDNPYLNETALPAPFSTPKEDVDELSGFARRTMTKTQVKNPTTGQYELKVNDITINEPWTSKYDGPGWVDAYKVDTQATLHRSLMKSGSFRDTITNTTFDTYGRPTQVKDQADTSEASDDRCTKTRYYTNATKWILAPVAVQEVTAGACTSERPQSAGDVISATRNVVGDANVNPGTATDTGTLSTNDTLVYKTQSAKGFADGEIQYQDDATNTFDANGRITQTADALGHTTTTSYHLIGATTPKVVPADATTLKAPDFVLTKDPKGHLTTTQVSRFWGSPLKASTRGLVSAAVDDQVTEYEYDGLGRLTAGWAPGRDRTAHPTEPTAAISYSLFSSKPSYVTTKTLGVNGNYLTSRTYYDGLQRPRSTEAPTGTDEGGRLLTDNHYDSLGRVESQRGPYFNSSPIAADGPNNTMYEARTEDIPSYTNNTYDRTGRVVAAKLLSKGSEKWQTITDYYGDQTTVTPPHGGTMTTTLVDARGQTTELRQHSSSSVFDTTNYTYTSAGKLKTVKTPVDNGARSTWTYEYDIRGNKTDSFDPDAGHSVTTYDALNRPVTATNGDGQTLWTGYDELGRKIHLRDGGEHGTELASWSYDTQFYGKLDTSVRHIADGEDYTNAITEYDALGRPTKTSLSIPGTNDLKKLHDQGPYTTETTYYENGQPKTVRLPGTIKTGTKPGTDTPNEVLRYTYDDLGRPKTFTGADAYVADTTYSPLGQLNQRVLGNTVGRSIYDTRDYDAATSRLTRREVALQTSATTPQLDQRYKYDDAGNITSLDDLPTATGTNPFRQCFEYDYLQRMTDAWSRPSTSCTEPTESSPDLGSETPYWDHYTYSKSGNRASWIQVRGTGASAHTTTHTSTYPDPASAHPHALTSVTSAGANAGTEAFSYTPAGQTETRTPSGSGKQDITWDEEGHQASVTKGTQTTTYVYDADGNRLLKKDQASHEIILYVGPSEFTDTNYGDPAAKLTLSRNYTVNDEPVASRTSGALAYILGDKNNSGQLAINGADLATTSRRYTPFGEDVAATPPAWPNQHGYLDKSIDTFSGTTHLGAREYDPKLGRFLSADSVLDTASPQQMNGYAYANNSPVTMSDPTGLYQTAGEWGQAGPGAYHSTDGFNIHWTNIQANPAGGAYGFGFKGMAFGGWKEVAASLASVVTGTADLGANVAQGQLPFTDGYKSYSTDWVYKKIGAKQNTWLGMVTDMSTIYASGGAGSLSKAGIVGGAARAIDETGALGSVTSAAARTGTVWDDITATAGTIPGTGGLPKSFELAAGDSQVWVHGNVTDHLADAARGAAKRGQFPEMVALGTQQRLRSLQAAVASAGRGGLPLSERMTVGGWELEFRQRAGDSLPALIHGRTVG